MNDRVTKLIKIVSATVAGAAIVITLLAYYGAFTGELTASELISSLADAFTVPGILMLAICALIWVSTLGFFDGTTYTIKYAVHTLIPGMRYRRIDRYSDYKDSRENKRIKGYGFLLFVGAGFVLVGIVFTVIFFLV